MVQLRVVSSGETLPLQVPEEMRAATDEQILSYASETLNKEFSSEEYQVERTPEAILIHPKARYG